LVAKPLRLTAARNRAEQAAQDSAVRVGRDRQVHRVEVHHQPEQIQVERPERPVEDRADLLG